MSSNSHFSPLILKSKYKDWYRISRATEWQEKIWAGTPSLSRKMTKYQVRITRPFWNCLLSLRAPRKILFFTLAF